MITFIKTNSGKIAALALPETFIKTTQEALELMMNGIYEGAEIIILHEKNLVPEFFDLKTGVAGDMLQKFSTYGAKLIIIGDFEQIKSNSLKAFVSESNTLGRINFLSSLEKAKEVL